MSHTYYDAEAIAAMIPGSTHAAHTNPGRTWRAPCPAHGGDNPTSLSIEQGPDKTLLHCHAHGCSIEDICGSLGIRPANLFMEPPSMRRTAPSGTATRTIVRERQAAFAPSHDTTGQSLTPHEIKLDLVLGFLEYGDYNTLNVPEARELLATSLNDPLQKAIIAQRLTKAGIFPPDIYKIVGHDPSMRESAPGIRQASPLITTMDSVTQQAVTWLWWPYLALGTLSMLDGDPGIGKSLLTIQLAATISRGRQLPDSCGVPYLSTGTPASTLFCAAEDSLAATMLPRLSHADADLTKCHVLTGWRGAEDEEYPFSLQDMDVLRQALNRTQPRLVIIDPIQAYLGPKVDMHRANETRPLLAALARVAEEYQCCVLCVRHPAKASGQGGGKALMRGLGSVDIIGAARTGFFLEQHPLDSTRALLAQTKNNYGPLGRTQIFSKADGLFAWDGVTRMDAELLAGAGRGPDPRAFFEAFTWLESRLEGGIPVPAADVEAQAEDSIGCSAKVLRRAKKTLGVISKQESAGGWTWRLPSLSIISPPAGISEYTGDTVPTGSPAKAKVLSSYITTMPTGTTDATGNTVDTGISYVVTERKADAPITTHGSDTPVTPYVPPGAHASQESCQDKMYLDYISAIRAAQCRECRAQDWSPDDGSLPTCLRCGWSLDR